LPSVTGQQGVAYCHKLSLASEVSEEVATQIKSPKIAVVNHPTLIWGPAKRNPRECAHAPYISRN